MAYNFDNMTCREFTEVLSSRDSVPGGGGAAAMVGAIAVSLGNMVGNLTTGKPQYAAVEPEIQAALEQGEQLRQHLLDLVEADAAAFAPMSAVFKMPKSTDEEKAARKAAMNDAMKNAVKPQMDLMDTCLDVLRLMAFYVEKGSRIMVSDAAVGAALCRGVMESGYINVVVNTSAIDDLAYTGDTEKRAEEMLDAGKRIADLIVGRSLEMMRSQW